MEMSLKWVTPPFPIKTHKGEYGTASSRIILSSFEDRKKQNDQISIQIHLDQSKTYLLLSLVGCSKVYLTELLPLSADLTEFGRETKSYRVR